MFDSRGGTTSHATDARDLLGPPTPPDTLRASKATGAAEKFPPRAGIFFHAQGQQADASERCRTTMSDITRLLGMVRDGQWEARDELFAAAYPELRALARSRLRRASDPELNATSLVHETYLRFAQAGQLRAADRRAFFAYAAQVMQSVILNEVRRSRAERRGGDARPFTLDTELMNALAVDQEAVLKVHDSLLQLEQSNPRLAEVARMRYFGGFSNREIADALDVTVRTVVRDWERARFLLSQALR
jgi:RNA polymerase sigma factor (TIGR02999 family)